MAINYSIGKFETKGYEWTYKAESNCVLAKRQAGEVFTISKISPAFLHAKT
ncbi:MULTISPECIES: hypothetical protein [Bacillaceae]|uniref:hypothetical protein n=1 Tax=Bacillaceae TaxID=186817 RepID=UPI001651E790|nr:MULTISPECIES: hypothetical protein [Bacillaceae]